MAQSSSAVISRTFFLHTPTENSTQNDASITQNCVSEHCGWTYELLEVNAILYSICLHQLEKWQEADI